MYGGQLLSSFRVSASLAWSLGLEGSYWLCCTNMQKETRDGIYEDRLVQVGQVTYELKVSNPFLHSEFVLHGNEFLLFSF